MFFTVLAFLFLVGMFIAWHERVGQPSKMNELKKPAWLWINALTLFGTLIALLSWDRDIHDAAALAVVVPLGALVFTYARIIGRKVWKWLCYNLEPLNEINDPHQRCFADGKDLANRQRQPGALRARQLELAGKYHQQS